MTGVNYKCIEASLSNQHGTTLTAQMTRDIQRTLKQYTFLCSPLKKKKSIFTIYYLRWFINRHMHSFFNEVRIVHKLKESTHAAPLGIPNHCIVHANRFFYI